MRDFKHVVNTMTALAILLGFLALWLLLLTDQYLLAALCIGGAATIDCLDGKLARRYEVESDLGIYLDSLNDFISLSLAPVTMLLVLRPIDRPMLLLILALLYLGAALFRLIRFISTPKSSKTVTGLPTTISGLCLITLLLFDYHLRFMNPVWLVASISLLSVLMISSIPFKKW